MLRVKTWWTNGVLIVVSILASIILCEVLVATVVPQNLGTWGMTRDGITSHVPNLSVYLTQFKQVIRTNSHGMRDREHSIVKAPGTFRILILGDSFMEANQVAFEDSFASLLESELKGKLPGTIEIVNASVSGWGTDDELTYLMRYGFEFQPDLVLLGITLHNDIQDNLAQEFHSYMNGELHEKPRQDIPPVDYVILQIKEFLASHSHLYQIILRVKNSSWVQYEGSRLSSHVAALLSKEESNEEVIRGWGMTRLLLRKMKVETEKRGIALIAFMIPLWVQVSEEQLSIFLAKHQLALTEIVLDKPQLRLKEIGSQENLQTIDLLEVFRAAEQKDPGKLYLLGDGHWTAAGQYLAAKFVSERLTSLGHNR